MGIFSALSRVGITIMFVARDAGVAAQAERVLFMRDGKIAGEMLFPKLNGDALEARTGKARAKMQKIGI